MLDGVLMNASLAGLLRLAIQWSLSAVLTVKRLTNSPWCVRRLVARSTLVDLSSLMLSSLVCEVSLNLIDRQTVCDRLRAIG